MDKAKSRAVLLDGRPYQKKADGGWVPLKGKTDWKRLDRQTPVQTEAIAVKDRDGRPMSDEEWASAEIIHPRKVAVGIRLDKRSWLVQVARQRVTDAHQYRVAALL